LMRATFAKNGHDVSPDRVVAQACYGSARINTKLMALH
jgi:hypothetical protein